MKLYRRSISIKPHSVYETLRDFPAALTLRLEEGQTVWFTADREGRHLLESEPYVDEPGAYLIIIPEVSGTELTTIYVFSDQSIPDQ